MAYVNQNQVERTQQSGRKGGFFLFNIIGLLFFSLIVSIAVEWLCMTFIWPEEGSNHSKMMLVTEMEYLNADFNHAVFGAPPVFIISEYVRIAYHYLFVWTKIEDVGFWIGNSLGVLPYIDAMKFISQLYLVRICILIFSLPMFVLFAIVGITSGFALRDIRRWSGGREYGGVYHRAKKIAPAALILSWFIYLASPISLHPNMIILPCAVFFGINILIICASFKKYL